MIRIIYLNETKPEIHLNPTSIVVTVQMRALRKTMNAALTTNVHASRHGRAASTHIGRDSVNLSSQSSINPNPIESSELLKMLAQMLETYRAQQKSLSLETLEEKDDDDAESQEDVIGEEGPDTVSPNPANRWQSAVAALSEHEHGIFHVDSPVSTSSDPDPLSTSDVDHDTLPAMIAPVHRKSALRASESLESPSRFALMSSKEQRDSQRRRSAFNMKKEQSFMAIISAAVDDGQFPGSKDEPGQNREKRASWFTEKQTRRLSRRRSVVPLDIVQLTGGTDQDPDHRWYFHPFSFGRLAWEGVMFTVAAAHVIMAPLYFAWKDLFIYQLSYVVVLVFVIDMLVQALTSYMKTDGKNFGLWEKEPATLISFYVKQYFVLDLVIAFPMAAFALQHIGDDSVWNVLSLLDIVKLVRVRRAFLRFKRGTLTNPSLWKVVILWCILLYGMYSAEHISLSSVIHIPVTFVSMFVFAVWHILACLYWLIENYLGLDETTMGPPMEFRDTHFLIEYSWAVFWVVSVNAGSATYPEKPIEAILACTTGKFLMCFS